jgi:hypothetical protein
MDDPMGQRTVVACGQPARTCCGFHGGRSVLDCPASASFAVAALKLKQDGGDPWIDPGLNNKATHNNPVRGE